MVVNEMRRYVEGPIEQLSKLLERSPKQAQDLAKSLMDGGDQAARAVRDLAEWSRVNRERAGVLLRTELRSQLKRLGVASRDEVDALRRRVRALERSGDASQPEAGRRSTGRKRSLARSAATPTSRTTSVLA